MIDNIILKNSISFYKNINQDKINNTVPIYSESEKKYNFCPFTELNEKINNIKLFEIYLNKIEKEINNTNNVWASFLHYKKYFLNLIILSINHIKKVKTFDSPYKILVSDPKKVFMSIAWLWQDILMRALFSYPIKSTNYSLFLNLSYLIIDYYFDDPKNSKNEKNKFSNYIQKRILQSYEPYDLFSSKFDSAMKIVEKEYPRNNENNTVYSSIYDMFIVEKESMESESINNENFSDEELLNIMAKKGIQTLLTIVHIAEFDSKKDLNENQKMFMIKFGFLTQIIDDICDIKNDLDSNCKTYYIRLITKHKTTLDKYTYLALNYIDSLYNDLIKNNYFNHTELHNQKVSESMRTILTLWLMYGVCKNKDFYSNECYENLEKYSFLSFNDLKNIRNDSKPTLLKLLSTN